MPYHSEKKEEVKLLAKWAAIHTHSDNHSKSHEKCLKVRREEKNALYYVVVVVENPCLYLSYWYAYCTTLIYLMTEPRSKKNWEQNKKNPNIFCDTEARVCSALFVYCTTADVGLDTGMMRLLQLHKNNSKHILSGVDWKNGIDFAHACSSSISCQENRKLGKYEA